MKLTWLGHSSVLLEVDGVRILADPLLRPFTAGLRRAAPLPETTVAIQRGDIAIDVVLLSHLHHDHCDLPSLRTLAAPRVIAPPGASEWLRSCGLDHVEELAVGDAAEIVDEVVVQAVWAEHPRGRTGRNVDSAAVGHLINAPSGSTWLAGDTALYPEMSDLAALTRNGRLDLAAVPVSGWGMTLGPGHMDADQAAEAVRRSGAAHAVPVHWGTLHPAGLRRQMAGRLKEPGPKFAESLTGLDAQAHVLDVGATLDLT